MNITYFLISIMMLTSCINSTQREATESVIFDDASYGKIESAFQKRGIEGCFILHDVKHDTCIIYNKSRARQHFLPASTFKIPNSLIALECEVIGDENEIILWDSVERNISIWNKNHNLQTGIKYSVVWFYQELARRIGEERMQSWVKAMDYGNMEIGNKIDNFWLEGELRITPT